jgi:hypothetical protein
MFLGKVDASDVFLVISVDCAYDPGKTILYKQVFTLYLRHHQTACFKVTAKIIHHCNTNSGAEVSEENSKLTLQRS